jgi:hypothetical protein
MRAFPLCLLLLVLLPQCGGGGSTGGSEPKSPANGESGDSGDDNESSADADGDEDSGPSAQESKPRGPNCDDGTCSLCGSGICPSGWYCDEGASGGPACSWLTECADKPSCGCITRVLGPACKCREEGGGLKVSCN